MRYTILVSILFLSIGKTYGHSDSLLQQPISIDIKQQTLANVFSLISEQSGVVFSYDPQSINTSQAVSLQVKNEPLSAVLDKLLGTSITYKEKGAYIILLPAKFTNGEAGTTALKPEKNKATAKEQPFFSEKISYTASGNNELVCHSSVNAKNDEQMKKQITTLLLALATTTTINKAAAQAEIQNEEKNSKAFQISLVYPLGSDGTKSLNHTYKTSINIIGGNTGGLQGVEFGSIFNKNTGVTKGAQFAGILNLTQNTESVQFAGIINVSETVNGANQLAGCVNLAKTGKATTQLAGIANLTESSKVQLAGIANSAKEEVLIQGAGIANVADTAACQVGGIVNLAKKSKIQVGLINVSDEAKIQLGVVNISKNGFMEGEIAGGEFLQTTASFRSGTRYLYGIVSLGYSFNDEFFGLGFGLGHTVELGSNLGVNLEVVQLSLATKKFNMEKYNSLTQVRPVFYYKLAKNFKLFAGPVANLLTTSTDASNKLTVSAPYTIWEEEGTKTKQAFWVGFTAGVRF